MVCNAHELVVAFSEVSCWRNKIAIAQFATFLAQEVGFPCRPLCFARSRHFASVESRKPTRASYQLVAIDEAGLLALLRVFLELQTSLVVVRILAKICYPHGQGLIGLETGTPTCVADIQEYVCTCLWMWLCAREDCYHSNEFWRGKYAVPLHVVLSRSTSNSQMR